MYNINRYLSNIPGWRTNRKIIVLESDDWGSIRMPSVDVYQTCLKAGYPVDLNPYERYDSVASKDDLELLFELLYSFQDKNNNHPIITANCVVANPDFIKIKEDDFRKYHYELITETFKRYPEHSNNFELWNAGKRDNIFYPQFHAREHLNVSKFMTALQNGNSDALFGFNNRMPGGIKKGRVRNGNYFVEATNYNSEKDKTKKLEIYLEGLDIFKNLFGYKSKSIIPTNYIWNNDYNLDIAKKGVEYIQGIRKMRIPVPNNKQIYQHRFLGGKNKSGQINLVRNCSFEPSLTSSVDKVDQCLNEIAIAFKMNKPAVISSHRINFIGFIDSRNRDNNLKSFKQLLHSILKRWPEVEFMTSVQLGDIIKG